jgi:hypothetical protein
MQCHWVIVTPLAQYTMRGHDIHVKGEVSRNKDNILLETSSDCITRSKSFETNSDVFLSLIYTYKVDQTTQVHLQTG